MALQEESESKQVVLDYVDTVIDEAKRELFEGLDAGDLSQSLDFQPSEIKRLATQKLNTKFQQVALDLVAQALKACLRERGLY